MIRNLSGADYHQTTPYLFSFFFRDTCMHERFLQLNKSQLEWVLTEGLITLKKKRPELFTLSGPEQLAMILRLLFE